MNRKKTNIKGGNIGAGFFRKVSKAVPSGIVHVPFQPCQPPFFIGGLNDR